MIQPTYPATPREIAGEKRRDIERNLAETDPHLTKTTREPGGFQPGLLGVCGADPYVGRKRKREAKIYFVQGVNFLV